MSLVEKEPAAAKDSACLALFKVFQPWVGSCCQVQCPESSKSWEQGAAVFGMYLHIFTEGVFGPQALWETSTEVRS